MKVDIYFYFNNHYPFCWRRPICISLHLRLRPEVGPPRTPSDAPIDSWSVLAQSSWLGLCLFLNIQCEESDIVITRAHQWRGWEGGEPQWQWGQSAGEAAWGSCCYRSPRRRRTPRAPGAWSAASPWRSPRPAWCCQRWPCSPPETISQGTRSAAQRLQRWLQLSGLRCKLEKISIIKVRIYFLKFDEYIWLWSMKVVRLQVIQVRLLGLNFLNIKSV